MSPKEIQSLSRAIRAEMPAIIRELGVCVQHLEDADENAHAPTCAPEDSLFDAENGLDAVSTMAANLAAQLRGGRTP